MKDLKKKKKVKEERASTSKVSTREKMMQRNKKLKSKEGGFSMIFPKEGTLRMRLMDQGPDEEIGLEIIQFYLGGDLGAIISPASFDEPCPFMEKYKELKASDDEDDNELANKLIPRRRYILGCTLYKDEKGKEVDPDNICKPILVPRTVYQDITDLYLDEDDWGDMTDPETGYDIKITRSGSGKMDTNYTVTACPGKKPIAPKYRKTMDLKEIISNNLKSYDELEEILNKFLNNSPEDEEEERPKKKDKRDKKKLKKKPKSDLD